MLKPWKTNLAQLSGLVLTHFECLIIAEIPGSSISRACRSLMPANTSVSSTRRGQSPSLGRWVLWVRHSSINLLLTTFFLTHFRFVSCGVKLGGWSLFKFDFLHISIRTSDLPMQYKSVIYSLTNLVRQVREKFSSNLISSLSEDIPASSPWLIEYLQFLPTSLTRPAAETPSPRREGPSPSTATPPGHPSRRWFE